MFQVLSRLRSMIRGQTHFGDQIREPPVPPALDFKSHSPSCVREKVLTSSSRLKQAPFAGQGKDPGIDGGPREGRGGLLGLVQQNNHILDRNLIGKLSSTSPLHPVAMSRGKHEGSRKKNATHDRNCSRSFQRFALPEKWNPGAQQVSEDCGNKGN